MPSTLMIDTGYEIACRITRLREEADEMRDKWLRSNGWELTCSTPGSFWMWRKAEFFCDSSTAERIQRIWSKDAYFAAHPEFLGE